MSAEEDEQYVAEQRARAGAMAAEMLGVTDEVMMAKYGDLCDSLAVFGAHLIQNGISLEATFSQMHAAVVAVQFKILEAVGG